MHVSTYLLHQLIPISSMGPGASLISPVRAFKYSREEPAAGAAADAALCVGEVEALAASEKWKSPDQSEK